MQKLKLAMRVVSNEILMSNVFVISVWVDGTDRVHV
jgi:hypothetical protein